jgi:hypothetical protein
MAFPPNPNAAPPAPPAPTPQGKTLADVSAQGTTQGAPVAQISKGPPQAPAGGPVPGRPVVAPHFGAPSVGTHPSASPNAQGNPTYGMGNG